jgi:hypothetical protein
MWRGEGGQGKEGGLARHGHLGMEKRKWPGPKWRNGLTIMAQTMHRAARVTPSVPQAERQEEAWNRT